MPQKTFFPVSEIIDEIQRTLMDEVGFEWDAETDLLPLLNRSISEIVWRDPVALAINSLFLIQPFKIEPATVPTGSGYAVGDTITLAGGTSTSSCVLEVTAINATGGVDSVQINSYGSYTAYPSNPVSQASTSGAGTGAQFNLYVNGPRQELPGDGVAIVDVRRNMGTDGRTTGSVITSQTRDHMDAVRPEWVNDVCGASGAPAAPVHYVTDERDPRRFYIWPTPASTWYVEMVYHSVPDDVGLTDGYPIPAMYIPYSIYYVIWRALSKRKEDYLKYQPLVQQYKDMFLNGLGATTAAITTITPRKEANRS